jgi:hypothetical protein
MTTIAEVRSHAADKYQYDRVTAQGDGTAADFALANPPVRPNTEKVWVNGALKADPADYTIDDDLGVVTFVTAPAPGAQVVVTYQWSLLSDADVQDFIDGTSSVYLAAADALDAIASSEALVQKRITILDLSTDGPAVARSLRDHAESLRLRVSSGVGELDDPGFDVAEQVLTPSAFRDKILGDALKES